MHEKKTCYWALFFNYLLKIIILEKIPTFTIFFCTQFFFTTKLTKLS